MQNTNKHRNKAENNIRDNYCTVILNTAVSYTHTHTLTKPSATGCSHKHMSRSHKLS